MSALKDIHIEVLKYMYDNNARILQRCEGTKQLISRKVSAPRKEAQEAIVYLADIGLLIRLKDGVEEHFRISPKGIDIYEKEILHMGIDTQLKEAVDNDIIKLESTTEEETKVIFDKYKNHIDGVNNNLTYSSRFREELKAALEGFKLFGYKNRSDNTRVGTQVNVNNQNDNTNINSIDISITFDQARDRIENNPYLAPEAIAEIVEKINELETINNESASKPNKWAKTKGVLSWLATQGVEIAATIIPLVLKVISSTGA